MARTPAEIEPTVFEVAGVDVSHLSYTFSYHGVPLPADQPSPSAVIDPVRILEDAATARSLGAELVRVSMHWGGEGVSEPTAWQRSVADEITAGGLVDLVIGHHAHVLQPIELVNDTCVLYGLGNIVSNMPTSGRWPAARQDAAVVTIDATIEANGKVAWSKPRVHPTWVDKDAGWVVRLVDAELARTDIGDGQRKRLRRSRARTADVLAVFMDPPAVDR